MSNCTEQTMLLRCRKGLHVLRYASALDLQSPPIVTIASSSELRLMAAPDLPATQLDAPGAVVVALAIADTTISLQIRPRQPGGSCAVDLKLETLVASDQEGITSKEPVSSPVRAVPGGHREKSAQKSSVRAAAAATAGVPQIDLLAHLARRGDVTVHANEWAGGPSVPTQIEGLELRISSVPDAAFEYQVYAAGAWSNWVNGGRFAGSRGRALPMTGIRIRLSDEAIPGFALNAECIFLGSTIVRRVGRYIELSTAAGLDPLVGLKLTCEQVTGGNLTEVGHASNALSTTPMTEARSGAKIRIFRSLAQHPITSAVA